MFREPRSSAPLDRIPVQALGAGEGQITLLPPGEISYAFLGSAAPTELLAICREKRWCLEAGRVYLRTARAIYRTSYRRLAELGRELEPSGPRLFFPIGRACFVNTMKIAALDTAGRTPLLVFHAADGSKEMLMVTRRAWPALRERLRLRRRSGGAPGPASGSRHAAGDMPATAHRRGDRNIGKTNAR